MECPRLTMDFHSSTAGCKDKTPPSFCPVCGISGWRNGLRIVAQMMLDAAGCVYRVQGIVRLRYLCSNPACECGSWTIYEPQGYPHRTFTLAVGASAVSELAASPEANLTSVAERCQCDRRTVGRWVRWAGALGQPQELGGLCGRLDPSGLPPPTHALPGIYGPVPIILLGQGAIALAGLVVLLLEHLARLMREQGVPLEVGPGLAAILRHQFNRFGMVSCLTRASPPLRVEPGWAGA